MPTKKRTEFDISLGRSSQGGWTLHIKDERSHLTILSAHVTDEQLGGLFGGATTASGELIHDENHGKYKKTQRRSLPVTPSYGEEWEATLDMVQKRLDDEGEGWQLLRDRYHAVSNRNSLYQFSTVRWDDTPD